MAAGPSSRGTSKRNGRRRREQQLEPASRRGAAHARHTGRPTRAATSRRGQAPGLAGAARRRCRRPLAQSRALVRLRPRLGSPGTRLPERRAGRGFPYAVVLGGRLLHPPLSRSSASGALLRESLRRSRGDDGGAEGNRPANATKGVGGVGGSPDRSGETYDVTVVVESGSQA